MMNVDWEKLYALHAPELLRFLAKFTGEPEVATELMQETFVRGIRSGDRLEQVASPRAWLFRVAANLATDYVRRRKLLRFIPFTGRESAQGGIPDPEADRVHRALRALPSAQAAALLLHYDAGFTRKEIAEMEGISEEGVKSRLARGRDAFALAYGRTPRRIGR